MSNFQRLFYVLLSLATLGAVALFYYPFLSDDALISLRYSMRLVAGDGLSWNDGYYVEGYSNLSWVLAVAGLHAVGMDPIIAARLLGVVLCGATLATFLYVGLKRVPGRVVGPAFLVSAGLLHSVAIWAIGGLEQPLALATLFFASYALIRWWEAEYARAYLWLAGSAFAVLVITRPDAPLFAALSVAIPLLSKQTLGKRCRDAARLLALPTLAFFGQLLFRLAYYDSLVPNTAHAKVAFSVIRAIFGFEYVAMGALTMAVPLVLIFAAAWTHPRKMPPPFWVFLLMAVSWGGYLVLMGGDIFPGYRHFMPLIALLWAMALIAVSTPFVEGLEHRAVRIGWSAKLGVIGLVALLVVVQFLFPENYRAKLQRWEWSCKNIAQDLRAEFESSDPLLAVTAAGCLPYWTEFETVDLLGLNDRELPKRKPEGFGRGYVGHELGDLDYLLERAPDIVVFHHGIEPILIYKEQIDRDHRFDDAYCRTDFDYPRAGKRTVYYRRGFVSPETGDAMCDLAELP